MSHTPTSSRRDLLRGAAAGLPLVLGIYGFSALGCGRRHEAAAGDGDPSPGAPPSAAAVPAWWKEALARMNEEGKPGMVLRIPEKKGPKLRFGWGVIDLLDGEDADVRSPFLEAVFVVLSASDVAAHVAGAKPDEDVVLVDAAGKRADGVKVDLGKAVENHAEFSKALKRLLHGPDDARLEERARAAKAVVPDDVLAALERMATDADATLVAANASRVAPLLILARRDARGDRLTRLQQAIVLALDGASKWRPGPRLPFGIEVERGEGGCGVGLFDDEGEPLAVACGMAMPTADARQFLKYLGT